MLPRNKKRLILGWFKYKAWGIDNGNWGDDINLLFFNNISKINLFDLRSMFLNRIYRKANKHLIVGSIIEMFNNPNNVIWGSGAMFGTESLMYKPKKVLAVRGPLTRQYLLSQGIDCPEVYGDPALLISKYYHPKVTKRYKLGIIPHFSQLTNPNILKFASLHPDDVVIIKMRGYEDWRDIPDLVCQCEKVVSSSLHGLIISDAYRIPNIWATFHDKVMTEGGSFKFLDYIGSVHRSEKEAVILDSTEKLENIFSKEVTWQPIDINLDTLIACCPFKLRNPEDVSLSRD